MNSIIPLSLSLAYLYPRSMNIYGDRGNVIALEKRCRWRGIKLQITEIEVGEKFDQTTFDLVFAGGGQDRHQLRIAQDLQLKKKELHAFVKRGGVGLTVCGTYQLFGHYFKTADGLKLNGISIFDAFTIANPNRKIGNVIVELLFNSQLQSPQPRPDQHHKRLNFAKTNTLVGFENHSGNTFLNSNPRTDSDLRTQALGKVFKGFGNNGEDGYEGARYRNCFGTYLHGSLLPKNPHFADYLITLALEKKYQQEVNLEPLDDSLELKAHNFILQNRA